MSNCLTTKREGRPVAGGRMAGMGGRLGQPGASGPASRRGRSDRGGQAGDLDVAERHAGSGNAGHVASAGARHADRVTGAAGGTVVPAVGAPRSEEHTSEL